MKRIFNYEKYKFSLYDVNTSIIYNDEKIKNKIINILPLDDYVYINYDVIPFNISVRNYLELNEFKMSLIPSFNLQSLVSSKYSSLDLSTMLYLKIIVNLTSHNGIVIFDDVLSYLTDEQKKIITKYIFNKNITFINFTSDIEEVLYSDYLIALTKSGVAIEGGTKEVLNEEKLLKRLGFNLPFAVDLSIQLKSYEVIDKVYYSVDGLVDALWK